MICIMRDYSIFSLESLSTQSWMNNWLNLALIDSLFEKDWISWAIESINTLTRKRLLMSYDRWALSMTSMYWQGSQICSRESCNVLSDLASQILRRCYFLLSSFIILIMSSTAITRISLYFYIFSYCCTMCVKISFNPPF